MVRPHARLSVVLVTAAPLLVGACGSEYTIVNRSQVRPSPSSTIAARGLIGESPAIAEHLAQAYEVYTAQLTLLKQRRNKVRSRKRVLAGLATTAAIVGAYGDGDTDERLQQATGVATGTMFGALGLTFVGGEQEDPVIADMKARQLQKDFERMLERVKELESELERDTGDAAVDTLRRKERTSEISTVIEAFITEATAINIKG
jgi:hypothetical protein